MVAMQTTASIGGAGGDNGAGGANNIKGHHLSDYSAVPSLSSRSPTERILREKGKGNRIPYGTLKVLNILK